MISTIRLNFSRLPSTSYTIDTPRFALSHLRLTQFPGSTFTLGLLLKNATKPGVFSGAPVALPITLPTRFLDTRLSHSKFRNAKSSTDLWKHVGELGLANLAHATFTLPTDIDTLNHYFAGDSNSRPLRDCRPSARISPDERFFFQYVSEVEALEATLSARCNAYGPDYIPCSFLKECLPTILPPLLNIFDRSLQSGVFPTAWKRAFVRPLPKINPPRESHLRPISILCASSKILEAVVHKQISRYVADKDVLDPLQSGFRKRHSTHTTLVSIVEDIREAVDNKQVVLAVAIDHTPCI